MREIKFRAWDKVDNWLGKVTSIDFDEETVFIETRTVDDENYFKFDDIELMQYTGLKDKNGKEIYEGDIVQQNYRDVYNQKQAFTGEVVYADCVYWLKNGDEYTFLYDEHRIYDSVIIGNIHENPELLEVAG